MTRRTPSSGRRRWGLAATAALLAVLLLAACGVPLDDEPRVIDRSTTTTEVPLGADDNPGSPRVTLYFLEDDTLAAQTYPVDGQPNLKTAISLVLSTSKPPAPLQNRIPIGTTLRKVELVGGQARIDLSDEMNDISGLTQKEAYAQIVFTALAFEAVTSVRFSINGKVVDAPTDNSNLRVVTAEDYKAPLNPR